MGRFNWGPEGPPDKAYSRVTEPDRFLPLVDWTLDLLSRIEAQYDVVREEGYGLDPELERADMTRPTVRLTPERDGAAPIVAAFTHYYCTGIDVRFGRYHTEPFPDCGCDACDETAEDAFESLQRVMEAVVAGQFREWFYMTPDGSGRVGREFWRQISTGMDRRELNRAARPGSPAARTTSWNGCPGPGGRFCRDGGCTGYERLNPNR